MSPSSARSGPLIACVSARSFLEELEAFDRGWYAGPFGWISGAGAEFVVAIRSALVVPYDNRQPPAVGALPPPTAGAEVHMFAGVGVIRGSDPEAEWQELELKVRRAGRLNDGLVLLHAVST
jgi:isochorismate synthase EntC